MKKILTALLLVLCALFYYGLTVQVIEKVEKPDDISYVGGASSHADIMYIDHRPTLKDKDNPAEIWWETKDGEWRRLETESYKRYSTTVYVLRDKTCPDSWFGVLRGSEKALRLQYKMDGVKKDYDKQGHFERVWIWEVKEMH